MLKSPTQSAIKLCVLAALTNDGEVGKSELDIILRQLTPVFKDDTKNVYDYFVLVRGEYQAKCLSLDSMREVAMQDAPGIIAALRAQAPSLNACALAIDIVRRVANAGDDMRGTRNAKAFQPLFELVSLHYSQVQQEILAAHDRRIAEIQQQPTKR